MDSLEEYHTAVIKDNRGSYRTLAPATGTVPVAVACGAPAAGGGGGGGFGVGKGSTGGGGGKGLVGSASTTSGGGGSGGSSGGSSIKFVSGPTSFFLEPYTELLEQHWYRILRAERTCETASCCCAQLPPPAPRPAPSFPPAAMILPWW